MKLRPAKRSLSPFGLSTPVESPESRLAGAVNARFGAPSEGDADVSALHSIEDARLLPALLSRLGEAPANDAPELDPVCQFILRFKQSFVEAGLFDPIYAAVQDVFDRKTELFLVDHWDRAHCEKVGLADSHRDIVLFARERDALVGRFFAPATEDHPGRFSEFVTRWMESENPDRVLHFLDFCAGSNNPTFEHYLLFSHPALHRVVTSKAHLRSLFAKAETLLPKIKSPTWEKSVRVALGV